MDCWIAILPAVYSGFCLIWACFVEYFVLFWVYWFGVLFLFCPYSDFHILLWLYSFIFMVVFLVSQSQWLEMVGIATRFSSDAPFFLVALCSALPLPQKSLSCRLGEWYASTSIQDKSVWRGSLSFLFFLLREDFQLSILCALRECRRIKIARGSVPSFMCAVIFWDTTSESLKTKVHSESKFGWNNNVLVEKCWPFRAIRGTRIFQSIHFTVLFPISFLICVSAAPILLFSYFQIMWV